MKKIVTRKLIGIATLFILGSKVLTGCSYVPPKAIKIRNLPDNKIELSSEGGLYLTTCYCGVSGFNHIRFKDPDSSTTGEMTDLKCFIEVQGGKRDCTGDDVHIIVMDAANKSCDLACGPK